MFSLDVAKVILNISKRHMLNYGDGVMDVGYLGAPSSRVYYEKDEYGKLVAQYTVSMEFSDTDGSITWTRQSYSD